MAKRVINVSAEVYGIISDYCQATGRPIGPWAEEILMDEMRRIFQKKGKRKEPYTPEDGDLEGPTSIIGQG